MTAFLRSLQSLTHRSDISITAHSTALTGGPAAEAATSNSQADPWALNSQHVLAFRTTPTRYPAGPASPGFADTTELPLPVLPTTLNRSTLSQSASSPISTRQLSSMRQIDDLIASNNTAVQSLTHKTDAINSRYEDRFLEVRDYIRELGEAVLAIREEQQQGMKALQDKVVLQAGSIARLEATVRTLQEGQAGLAVNTGGPGTTAQTQQGLQNITPPPSARSLSDHSMTQGHALLPASEPSSKTTVDHLATEVLAQLQSAAIAISLPTLHPIAIPTDNDAMHVGVEGSEFHTPEAVMEDLVDAPSPSPSAMDLLETPPPMPREDFTHQGSSSSPPVQLHAGNDSTNHSIEVGPNGETQITTHATVDEEFEVTLVDEDEDSRAGALEVSLNQGIEVGEAELGVESSSQRRQSTRPSGSRPRSSTSAYTFDPLAGIKLSKRPQSGRKKTPKKPASESKRRRNFFDQVKASCIRLRMGDGEMRGHGDWPTKGPNTLKGTIQEIVCELCKGRCHWSCAGLLKCDEPDNEWNCPDCVKKIQKGDDIEQAPLDRCIRGNCVLRAKKATERENDDEKEYVVEKIIGRRATHRHPETGDRVSEYLVKWAGWDIKDSTWEPRDHFDTTSLIDQYVQEAASVGVNLKKRISLLPSAQTAFDLDTGELKGHTEDDTSESGEGTPSPDQIQPGGPGSGGAPELPARADAINGGAPAASDTASAAPGPDAWPAFVDNVARDPDYAP